MINRNINNLPLWQFESLALNPAIRHFVSGREGGVSKGEKGALNLSYNVGDIPENVLYNRTLLAEAMGVEERNLIFPKQVHGNAVLQINNVNAKQDLDPGDALISNIPGICLIATAADCVPVLFFDEAKKAVAAAHAGWRGTVAKIVTNTLLAMGTAFGSRPIDVKVGIGPSISPLVYEVGEEVVDAVHQAFGADAGNLLIKPENSRKPRFNLWEANKLQLLKLGVPEENIEVAGICTYSNKDKFFSARASKSSGRFAAGIMLVD